MHGTESRGRVGVFSEGNRCGLWLCIVHDIHLNFSMCGVFLISIAFASTVLRRSVLKFVFDREHL